MKVRVKMKNRSHRSGIIDVLRHGYKYAKYKMCLLMIMVMCKQKATPKLHLKLNS